MREVAVVWRSLNSISANCAAAPLLSRLQQLFLFVCSALSFSVLGFLLGPFNELSFFV